MAKQVKIKAEHRTGTGRSAVRKLKARGIIPAVIYGAKQKPQPLQVSAREINTILSRASGENILVELDIDGEKGGRAAMLQEIQHSPLGDEIMHIDFRAVSMDQKIEADVPLEPMGVPDGVKNFGGLLEQSLRSLTIECLPGNLPDRITVEVSAMNIGDTIHVRDIPLPTGVVGKAQPDLTAFSVLAPAVEEVPMAAAAEAAAAGPEVITEKKQEGEAAAASAAAPAAKEKEQKK